MIRSVSNLLVLFCIALRPPLDIRRDDLGLSFEEGFAINPRHMHAQDDVNSVRPGQLTHPQLQRAATSCPFIPA